METTIFKYTSVENEPIINQFKIIGKVISNKYENNQGIVIIEGNKIEIPSYCFNNCRELTSIEIPNNILTISNNAFFGCDNLANVIIGDNVLRIEYSAFQFCCSLTTITLPNNLTFLGKCAFRDCSNLTKVILNNNLKTIGDGAFIDCKELTNIILPNSLIEIGSSIFFGCHKLIKKVSRKGVYYKGFNTDLTCGDYQFKLDCVNNLNNENKIKRYENVFYYYDNPLSVFDYYSGVDTVNLVIYKVKPSGEIIQGTEHKHVCKQIKLLERVTFNDIFEMLK